MKLILSINNANNLNIAIIICSGSEVHVTCIVHRGVSTKRTTNVYKAVKSFIFFEIHLIYTYIMYHKSWSKQEKRPYI